MKSNFEFLNKYWEDLAEIGRLDRESFIADDKITLDRYEL